MRKRVIAGCATLASTAGMVLAGPMAPPAAAEKPATSAAIVTVPDSIDTNVDVTIFDGTGSETGSFSAPLGPVGATFFPTLFAVGDVDGDGAEEFVFVGLHPNLTDGLVRVYDMSGGLQGTIFTGEPEGIATADFNGDRIDDIAVMTTTGDLWLYEGDGSSLGTINTDFDSDRDRFAVGYVGTDSPAEAVVAYGGGPGNPSGQVRLYRRLGGEFATFPSSYDAGDGLTLGDTNGDGLDEILIADADTDVVTVLDPTGAQIRTFGSVFSADSGFAAGDIDGNGTDEVLVTNVLADMIVGYDTVGMPVAHIPTGDRFAVGTFGRGDGDIDGDGIHDRVERFGLHRPDGTMALDLPALGASPCRKTIPIEIDYMSDAADGHSHKPDPAAIAEAVTAFDQAPVLPAVPCPFAGASITPGIDLIVMVDDPIAEQPVLGTPAAFQAVKDTNFDPILRPYVHYNLWVHDRAPNSGSSGVCCRGEDGKDFIVSLGSWEGQNGTVREQSGTLMHELGHVLGLGHGGGDGYNYKPNYLSVMNYWFQVVGLTDAVNGTSRIDYSRTELAQLDQLNLAEPAGIGSGPVLTSWYDSNGIERGGRGDKPLDWTGTDANNNGIADDDVRVAVDLDGDAGGLCVSAAPAMPLATAPVDDDVITNSGTTISGGSDMACETTATGGDVQVVPVGTVQRMLNGFDDWENLRFRGAASPDAGLQVEPVEELTHERAAQIVSYWEQLLSPDVRVTMTVNPTLTVPGGDTLSYTTTVSNVGSGPAQAVTLTTTRPDGVTAAAPLPDLVPGATVTRTFTYPVPQSTPVGSVLTGTAAASASSLANTPEKNTANNIASATTKVCTAVVAGICIVV